MLYNLALVLRVVLVLRRVGSKATFADGLSREFWKLHSFRNRHLRGWQISKVVHSWHWLRSWRATQLLISSDAQAVCCRFSCYNPAEGVCSFPAMRALDQSTAMLVASILQRRCPCLDQADLATVPTAG